MRKAVGEHSGQHAVQAVCILLLLALLIGIFIAEAQRNVNAYGRETAKIASYTVTDSFSGYIFREEAALHSSNNGPVEYLVADGSAVKAGDALAKAFVDDTGTDKRQAAAVLYEEIARLERSLTRDVVAWQLTYAESYGTLMDAIGAGDLRTGLNAAEALSATLERRSAFGDNEAAVRVRIATLRAQAEELVRYVDQPQLLSAVESGYFSYETDGYEALFGTAAAENLTPEGLRRLLDSKEVVTDTVGKLVSGGVFYLAVPVAPEAAEGYVVDATYRVRMARGGETNMCLVRVSPSADGSELLLIFRAEKSPVGMDLSRRQPVEIEREVTSGIRVPAAALYTENGEDVVYITSGGVAARRRVEVLCREGGSCIVAIRHEDGYLREGENVLITARSIYEGKVLNR